MLRHADAAAERCFATPRAACHTRHFRLCFSAATCCRRRDMFSLMFSVVIAFAARCYAMLSLIVAFDAIMPALR